MKITKEYGILDQLAMSALDQCPEYESKEFVDGFITYVWRFFINVDCTSAPFRNQDGTYDLDLNFAIEDTDEEVNDFAQAFILQPQKDFWKGTLLAESISIKILIFAFDIYPENFAA